MDRGQILEIYKFTEKSMKILVSMKNSSMLEIPINDEDDFDMIVSAIESQEFFTYDRKMWIRTREVASMECVE